MTAKKSDSSEQLLDYLVYAPVGLALEAIDNLPKYVQRGKSQVTLGRFFARTAAKKGSATIETVAERLVNEAGQVVVDLFNIDLRPDPDADSTEAAVVRPVAVVTNDADLPISEYDSQAAAQIIKLLAQLTPTELEEIAAYERAGRGRVTILRKVAQLQGDG